MQITDAAKARLNEALKTHPGKILRIYIRGFG